MSPPITDSSDPNIYEFFLDTCAYNIHTERAIEILHDLHHFLRTRQVQFSCTQQNMRELANSSTPEMLLASRRASVKPFNGEKRLPLRPRPNTLFAAFVERNLAWISCTETVKCRKFHDALTDKIFPESLTRLVTFIEEHHGKAYNAIKKNQHQLWETLLKSIPQHGRIKIKFPAPRQAFEIYCNALHRVQLFAFAMMSEHLSASEMQTRGIKSANDIRIINPLSGKIDNEYVIQALRNDKNLWQIVCANPKLPNIHHDCADDAMLSYLLHDLSSKPDRNNRILIVISDDAGLREKFISFATGYKLEDGVKMPLQKHDYQQHAPGPMVKDVPKHRVDSSRTITQFFRQELAGIQATLKTRRISSSTVNELLIELESCCKGIEGYCAGKYMSPDSGKFYETLRKQRTGHSPGFTK